MKLIFALSTDENFVVPALICITSIFENNKGEECDIYILTIGLHSESIAKFDALSTFYGQKIIIKTIKETQFNGLVEYGRFPLSMYFRFILPEELKDCERVLYLDCDIIVRRNLRHLFELKISNYSCAVVVDQNCDDISIINRLKINATYFNSGVMLINLNYWRNRHITKLLLEFIRDNPKVCIFPDQDALNVVLDGSVLYLDYTYNYQEFWAIIEEKPLIHFSKMESIRLAGKNPAIVHFCSINKPWFKECQNPYQKEFLHYAEKHTFVGFHIKRRRNIKRLMKRIKFYFERIINYWN